MLDKCPHCGGTEGYSERYVESFERIYEWSGIYLETTEGLSVQFYKTAYCLDCGKGYRLPTLERLQAKGGGE